MLLAGHPADLPIPSPPYDFIGPNGWGAATSFEMSAWVGPWGVSYAINLTPDQTTGIGAWNEEVFIAAMRTGKHMGTGRPIMPPMPWENYGKLKDEDLRAIFAYLKSLRPVYNQVPAYAPPSH